MILADKILSLRKKNGWSQEELAEKLQVSRQSISKWEGASSIPDINKILELAKIFGVSTDYLLKDDLEVIEYSDMDDSDDRIHVTLAEAETFINIMQEYGKQVAIGVVMCILSPITLIVLGGISETGFGNLPITEDMAGGIGVVVLLSIIAAAVAIFIISGTKVKRFEYLQKKEFTLEYGVEGIVREKQRAFADKNTRSIVTGVVLCILSPIPLITAGVSGASDMVCIFLTALLLTIIAVAVFFFITSGTVNSSFEQLLREGEYDWNELENNKQVSKVGGVFWPIIVAAYLTWSFLTNDWHITWLIWPVAGLVFAGISAAFKKES